MAGESSVTGPTQSPMGAEGWEDSQPAVQTLFLGCPLWPPYVMGQGSKACRFFLVAFLVRLSGVWHNVFELKCLEA